MADFNDDVDPEIAAELADTYAPEPHEAVVLIDRQLTGCNCTDRCEMPCWQRVGLTSSPCCGTCAPLPAVDDE